MDGSVQYLQMNTFFVGRTRKGYHLVQLYPGTLSAASWDFLFGIIQVVHLRDILPGTGIILVSDTLNNFIIPYPPGIRLPVSGYPGIRIVLRVSEVRVPGYPGTRVSGYHLVPGYPYPGYPGTRYLGIRILPSVALYATAVGHKCIIL